MKSDKMTIDIDNYKKPIIPKDYMSRHNKRWRKLNNTDVNITFEEVNILLNQIRDLIAGNISDYDNILSKYLNKLSDAIQKVNMNIIFYLKYNNSVTINTDDLLSIIDLYIMTDLFDVNHYKWYLLILESNNERMIETIGRINCISLSWFNLLTRGCRKNKFIVEGKLIFKYS